MKEIIRNINNLKEEEMTDFATKVKLLLVNSCNEILLGYSHHEYQFPGGTLEAGETLMDTVKRELMEETGLVLSDEKISPFAKSSGYYKDWPGVGRNKKVEIYYYEIKTDEKPNFDKIKLTDKEKEGNFTLRYVSLDDVEEELKNNTKEYGDPHGIVREMIELLKIYKEMK